MCLGSLTYCAFWLVECESLLKPQSPCLPAETHAAICSHTYLFLQFTSQRIVICTCTDALLPNVALLEIRIKSLLPLRQYLRCKSIDMPSKSVDSTSRASWMGNNLFNPRSQYCTVCMINPKSTNPRTNQPDNSDRCHKFSCLQTVNSGTAEALGIGYAKAIHDLNHAVQLHSQETELQWVDWHFEGLRRFPYPWLFLKTGKDKESNTSVLITMRKTKRHARVVPKSSSAVSCSMEPPALAAARQELVTWWSMHILPFNDIKVQWALPHGTHHETCMGTGPLCEYQSLTTTSSNAMRDMGW